MDDDEAPPELVNVTAFPDQHETTPGEKKREMREEDSNIISRVPITLVTGKKYHV